MKFNWGHYIAVQLQWTESLLARCQDTDYGTAGPLLNIARERLHDISILAETVSDGQDALSTCQ